jgi:prolyl 4-hydroxylase
MERIAELAALAESGDAAAQYQLAAALDRAGDAAGADRWLARAAAQGHGGALCAQALGMLAAPPQSLDAKGAAALLWRAVESGSAAAARRLAVLKALGLGTEEDWQGAKELLAGAARTGRPDAQKELQALSAVEAHAPGARRPVRPTVPGIAAIEGALSAFDCAYVIEAARPLLRPSSVADPDLGGARQAPFRTSDGAAIGLLSLDLALIAIWKKLCAAAGFAPAQSELMGVLRYRPGEEYRPHHDYLPEDAGDYSEVRRAGQRKATLLTSLNGGYAGGATVFPELRLEFRSPGGTSLLFENVDVEGRPIAASLHAGAPVTAGEKWMLTLWFRERRFWFW